MVYSLLIVLRIFFFFFLVFLRSLPATCGGSQVGVESEIQLPAYTTATAMGDLSHICDLHHSSWQRQILNPLSKARDWTCILMDASEIHFHWAMTGAPSSHISYSHFTNWFLACSYVQELLLHTEMPIITTWMFISQYLDICSGSWQTSQVLWDISWTKNSVRNASTILVTAAY